MFPDQRMATQRAQLNTTLPDTAILYTQSEQRDGTGRIYYASVAAGTVSARIDPVTNNREMIEINKALGREAMAVLYRLTVPYDTDLDVNYKVEIADTTYDVLQLEAAHSKRVSVRAIVGEAR